MKALAAATLMALSASQAMAIGEGDWLVRVGVGHVSPNDSSSDFSLAPGVGAGVGSDTRPTINLTYMMTDNIGLDVLGALPFEHTISATGALTGEVGTTKHLPPTIGVQYHFTPKSNIRPYVGVGVNYTHFWDESLNATGQAVLGTLELDDSFGLAGQIGVDMDINKDWFVNADVRYISISTEGTTANVGSIDVDIDPWVFILGVGTSF
jgi:outer membrane protein